MFTPIKVVMSHLKVPEWSIIRKIIRAFARVMNYDYNLKKSTQLRKKIYLFWYKVRKFLGFYHVTLHFLGDYQGGGNYP